MRTHAAISANHDAAVAAAHRPDAGTLRVALRRLAAWLRRVGQPPRPRAAFNPLSTATLRDIGLNRLELRAWPGHGKRRHPRPASQWA